MSTLLSAYLDHALARLQKLDPAAFETTRQHRQYHQYRDSIVRMASTLVPTISPEDRAWVTLALAQRGASVYAPEEFIATLRTLLTEVSKG